MKITVKYFGSVRDDTGTGEEAIQLDEGQSISDVLVLIRERHSALKARKGQILFALNQNYSDQNTLVDDGDEVALFPVVSGG